MSFSGYQEYKASAVKWLDWLPAHWDVRPLKYLSRIDNSGSYGVEPDDGEVVLPVATTAQIDLNGRFAVEKMPLRGFSRADVERYGCSEGEILVVKSSGSASNIISGKAGLVDASTPCFVFSNFLMRVRPHQHLILPSFIYALLTSNLTRQRVELMCSTTTYPNLQIGDYSAALLPMPPITEQRSIVAFLDFETARIDELIAEQQRLMDLLREKRQAVISHAVTRGLDPTVPMKDSGVPWLGEIPAHWQTLRVRQVLDSTKAGPFGSSLTKDMYVASGFRVYGQEQVIAGRFDIGDYYIDEERFKSLRQYEVSPGDVLVSCVGTFGKVAVVDEYAERGIINPRLVRLRPSDRILSQYLAMLLRDRAAFEQLEAASRGGTMDTINLTTLANVWLALPPLSEQEAIKAFVDKLSTQFGELEATCDGAVNRLTERRAALISAAVTGQIDVRGWVPPEAA